MLRFKLHHLFALSLFVAGLCQHPVRAMGIDFDLATQSPISDTSVGQATTTTQVTASRGESLRSQGIAVNVTPLPIPKSAKQPPISLSETSIKTLDHAVPATRILPPPPSGALPTSRVLAPTNTLAKNESIALSFESPQPLSSDDALAKALDQPKFPNWIYSGGSESLVARVIGSAEGTRMASGRPTKAYYGHTDPGNGVWNMGTFSYQHGAGSPQEADQKQLKRLERQGKTMANQAGQAELKMTLDEVLNGLDLANQSPRAALEQGGYVDRLVQAREQGMVNSDAIVWARTYSYLNPTTRRWNAPGLGNTLHSIQRDQHRRYDAVADAFQHYQAQRDKTDQPLKETLTESAVTSLETSVDTNSIFNNKQAETATQPVAKQTPIVPLTFKVTELVERENQAYQDTGDLITTSPIFGSELSSTQTHRSSPKDSSQAQANPENDEIQSHG